jgi:hypothetical protein
MRKAHKEKVARKMGGPAIWTVPIFKATFLETGAVRRSGVPLV